MKKILLSAVAAIALFSGCTKEYITYTTCDHDFAAVDTYYITIEPNQWHNLPAPPNGDGPYIYSTYNLPAITSYVIEQGVVLSYVIENGRDNLLPYLRPWGFNQFNEPYSQNVRFDLETGKITFIIEASDMDFPNTPTLAMEFKVSVIQNWTH